MILSHPVTAALTKVRPHEPGRREQFALAAQAAGLKLVWRSGVCKGGAYESAFIAGPDGELSPWNPAMSDADSRQLQIRLHLSLQFHNDGRDYWVAWDGCIGSGRFYVDEWPDSAAAAREAVLWIAADAGRHAFVPDMKAMLNP